MSEPALDTPFTKKSPIEWLIDRSRSAIRKRLGADYDPVKLIVLLGKICNQEALTDDEVLDLAEMFIFLMEHELNWKLGAKIFRYYLGEGGPSKLTLLMPNTDVLSSSSFCSSVCQSHWKTLQTAVQTRVLDTTGSLFPRDPDTLAPKSGWVYDDQGGKIDYTAQPSPLRAGGTETVYFETSTRVSSVEATELAAIFGAIGVVSQVTVKSTPDNQGHWAIEVVDWKTWAWDSGDFNGPGGPNTQELPIDISTFFGPEWVQDNVFKYLEEHFGIKKDCLQHFTGLDKYMRQLEGKTFDRVSVVTGRQVYYFPTFFMIFFAQWDFYTSTGGCQPLRTWTITEPAPSQ